MCPIQPKFVFLNVEWGPICWKEPDGFTAAQLLFNHQDLEWNSYLTGLWYPTELWDRPFFAPLPLEPAWKNKNKSASHYTKTCPCLLMVRGVMIMNLLENGGHVGDLVEEFELSLVEVFGWTRQRTCDLLDHLLQQLPYVSYTDRLMRQGYIWLHRLN